MIGGTSTGGLIAIMLGRLKMDVVSCIEAYTDLSEKIFTKKRHRVTIRGNVQGRFDTAALEKAVKELVVKQGLNENALFLEPEANCKVFVCATSNTTSETVILSNYTSPRRPSDDLLEVTTIWQAARATSAASSFFDSITFGNDTFIDGAIGANNPIMKLWTEAGDIWSRGSRRQLNEQIQCLISVGTGVPSLKSFGDDLLEIGKTLIAIATQTEATAEQFQQDHADLDVGKRLFRFNVLQGLEAIGLEDAGKKDAVIVATRRYLSLQTIFRRKKLLSTALQFYRQTLGILGLDDSRLDIPRVVPQVFRWFTLTDEYTSWLKGSSGPLMWFISSLTSENSGLVQQLADMNLGKQIKYGSLNVACVMCAQLAHIIHSSPPGGLFDAQAPVFLVEHPTMPSTPSLTEQILRSLIGQLIYANKTLIDMLQRSAVEWFSGDLLESLISDCQPIDRRVSLLWKLLSLILDIQEGCATVLYIDGLDTLELSAYIAFASQLLQETMEYMNTLRVSPVRNEETELAECLNSLRYEGVHERRDQVSNSLDGTNQWIWSHPRYVAWELEDSSILWIEGKAGSGKSTLAKAIQNKLRVRCELMVDHFYSSRQGAIGTSHIMMLRSLLYQLLTADPTLFRCVQTCFRKVRAAPIGFIEWLWYDLETAFHCVSETRDRTRKIYCVLDAMDESNDDSLNETNRAKVLQFVSSLVRLCLKSPHSGSQFKFVVLSRPARGIERELRSFPRIELRWENQKDIQKIIDTGLVEIRREMVMDDDCRSPLYESSSTPGYDAFQVQLDKIVNGEDEFTSNGGIADEELLVWRDYMIANAEGVVLWVILVINDLKQQVSRGLYSFTELREHLQNLPTALDKFYVQIVKDLQQRHSSAEIEKARRILLWISFAVRPMTIEEICETISVPFEEQYKDFSMLVRRRIHKSSWNQARLGLMEWCGPFIEVIHSNMVDSTQIGRARRTTEANDNVQLLHQTVKDFLSQVSALCFHIDPKVTPTIIAKSASDYLVLSLPVDDPTHWVLKDGSKLDHQDFRLERWDKDFYHYVKELNDRPLLSYCLSVILQRDGSQDSLNALLKAIKDPKALYLLEPRDRYVLDRNITTGRLIKSLADLMTRSSVRGPGEIFRMRCFLTACLSNFGSVARLLILLYSDPRFKHRGHGCRLLFLDTLRTAVANNNTTAADLIRGHPIYRRIVPFFKARRQPMLR
ncbi:hypothetical protein MMC18_001092 [Xylographa bjoerkii]|nr:hypothetical protein [Xylographa bjoerkii]